MLAFGGDWVKEVVRCEEKYFRWGMDGIFLEGLYKLRGLKYIKLS